MTARETRLTALDGAGDAHMMRRETRGTARDSRWTTRESFYGMRVGGSPKVGRVTPNVTALHSLVIHDGVSPSSYKCNLSPQTSPSSFIAFCCFYNSFLVFTFSVLPLSSFMCSTSFLYSFPSSPSHRFFTLLSNLDVVSSNIVRRSS